jgi:hypothetical protein
MWVKEYVRERLELPLRHNTCTCNLHNRPYCILQKSTPAVKADN